VKVEISTDVAFALAELVQQHGAHDVLASLAAACDVAATHALELGKPNKSWTRAATHLREADEDVSWSAQQCGFALEDALTVLADTEVPS
jgi:hypothetical protein